MKTLIEIIGYAIVLFSILPLMWFVFQVIVFYVREQLLKSKMHAH